MVPLHLPLQHCVVRTQAFPLALQYLHVVAPTIPSHTTFLRGSGEAQQVDAVQDLSMAAHGKIEQPSVAFVKG